MKVNVKELETSKEVLVKQLLQQKDENTESSVKLKTEIDSDNKLKMLSKENQDEFTRLNESRDLSKDIEEKILHQEKSETPSQKITASKVTSTEEVQSKEKIDTQKPDEEIDNKQIYASKVTPTEKVQSKEKTDTQKPDEEIDNKQISVGT